ncbi:MAG TPA: hypothetical protein VMJ64_18735 [Anaerolineales bacterium]|nr:hypothetical protein [Anaerolineales bacterium]
MSSPRPLRVLAKALAIFTVLNLAYAAVNPPIGRLSIYNWLVKGRERFAFGDAGSYNTSVQDIDNLFAAHVISHGLKPKGELRVILLGDSQTWGWTESSAETLTQQLNRLRVRACGRDLRFYNLAYPFPSVLRDFMVLHKALEYRPDLVVWMVTERGFETQDSLPFMFDKPSSEVQGLLAEYGLARYVPLMAVPPDLLQRTIVGHRDEFSRLVRAQVNGPLWDATSIDHAVRYGTPSLEVKDTDLFHGISPPTLPTASMTFDVLKAAHAMIGEIPVLVVNEPIFLPPGNSSSVRYNGEYPRWAYDEYRTLLSGFVAQEGWQYSDLFDRIPYTEFASAALHLTPKGEKLLAKSLLSTLLRTACP